MKSFKTTKTKILFASSAFLLTTSCGVFNFSKNKSKSEEKVDISTDIEQLRQTKPLGLTGNLQSFASCDEVLVRLKENLAQQLSSDLVGQMIWVNDYGGEVFADSNTSIKSASNESAEDSAGGSDGSDGPGDNNSSPSEHSETNNQVAGIEEADIVKTDGNYIYQAARGKLRIVKSWPANQLAEANSMDLDLRPIELFLDKDRKKVVVIGNKIEEAKPTEVSESGEGTKDMIGPSSGIYIDYETVLVAIIDVTHPAKSSFL
jgi:hypothetical protein